MSGWERCKLGLPSITTIVAHNQIEATETAEKSGAILNLGVYQQLTKDSYLEAICRILKSKGGELKIMSENCYKIFENKDSVDIPDLLKNLRSQAK